MPAPVGLSAGDSDVQAAMGRAVSWQTSMATVLCGVVALVLLSMWLFEKRDLASE